MLSSKNPEIILDWKNLGLPRESESFSILVSNANLRIRVQK